MKNILMATDLSARSDLALRRAVSLARQFDADLKVLHVTDEKFFDDYTQKTAWLAEQSLTAQLNTLPRANGLRVAIDVTVGIDFQQIIEKSEAANADLVVLGTHRHASRDMFAGTTAERVIRHGDCPVLVVRGEASQPYRNALVATDLSENAAAATTLAARLCTGGRLVLAHAIHRPFTGLLGEEGQSAAVAADRAFARTVLDETLARISEEMGDQAPSGEVALPEGSVREVLNVEIAAREPDLVALGTHGRSGIARAVLGSIAEEFLTSSPVDVLAVKAGRNR